MERWSEGSGECEDGGGSEVSEMVSVMVECECGEMMFDGEEMCVKCVNGSEDWCDMCESDIVEMFYGEGDKWSVFVCKCDVLM